MPFLQINEKVKDMLTEVTTNIVNNQIYAGGDYYVKSEAGDCNHIATNLMAEGNMRVDARDINILDAHAYRKIHQVSERSYAGIGVTVGVPILESAYQIKDSYKAMEGASQEGYINGGFQAMNTMFGFPGAINNPLGISGNISASYSKSEYNREESTSVGSNILVGGSVELNGENLHMRGSGLSVNENLAYNITKSQSYMHKYDENGNILVMVTNLNGWYIYPDESIRGYQLNPVEQDSRENVEALYKKLMKKYER